jgi:hypothetical protein
MYLIMPMCCVVDFFYGVSFVLFTGLHGMILMSDSRYEGDACGNDVHSFDGDKGNECIVDELQGHIWEES